MASDRSQYNRALRKWDDLHERQAYSLPVDEGYVAILCSDFEYSDEDERQAFHDEAHELATELATVGIESQIFPAFTVSDGIDALRDPEAISMITIGNGNFSEIYAHNGYSFNWKTVADYATHLKTGRFIQRHCGQPIRDMSVPLGTFAVDNHSNVIAAFNVTLPTVMDQQYENQLRSVHNYRRLGYSALKGHFPRIYLKKDEPDTAAS